MKPDSHPVSSAYRSPLKVVVQRFVQQRPLAASLCAHQRDVDVIIRPCKPLVSSGNGHRVRGHGGGKAAFGDGKCKGEQTSRPDFFLQKFSLRWANQPFSLASVVTRKRLTSTSTSHRCSLHPPTVGGDRRAATSSQTLSSPSLHMITQAGENDGSFFLFFCCCFLFVGLVCENRHSLHTSHLTVKSVCGIIKKPVEYMQMPQ